LFEIVSQNLPSLSDSRLLTQNHPKETRELRPKTH